MCGALQFCVESANIIFVGTDNAFRRRLRHDTKELDDDGEACVGSRLRVSWRLYPRPDLGNANVGKEEKLFMRVYPDWDTRFFV